MESFWRSFAIDPRDPQHAALRASDADRAVVSSVLADAYADGRLTAAEYDERSSANLAARTLGELPPLLADLVLEADHQPAHLPVRTPAQLRAQALSRRVREVARVAVASSTPFLICLVIWIFTGFGDFWPKWALIPMLLTILPAIQGSGKATSPEAGRLDSRERQDPGEPPETEGSRGPT